MPGEGGWWRVEGGGAGASRRMIHANMSDYGLGPAWEPGQPPKTQTFLPSVAARKDVNGYRYVIGGRGPHRLLWLIGAL